MIRLLTPRYSSSAIASLKSDAEAIFASGLDAVSPRAMVDRAIRFDSEQAKLLVGSSQYHIDRNVRLIAFGKAVCGMIRSMQEIVGDHIQVGIASIPVGLQEELRKAKPHLLPLADERLTIMEGAKNNLPDCQAQLAAQRILDVALASKENDLLVTLISGGGSALLPLPPPGVSLEDKVKTIETMTKAGASIHQLNTVRKGLSMVKGGRLAEAAYPAKVIGLILSDVIGDPLDIIASAPTHPTTSTPDDCLTVIDDLRITDMLPGSVLQHLKEQAGNAPFQTFPSNTENHIIGSNRIAIKACTEKAKTLGYNPIVFSSELTGEARDVGRDFALMTSCIYQGRYPTEKMKTLLSGIQRPLCVIAGGETTVRVKGKGIGGRNQELALSASMHMKRVLSKEEQVRCLLLSGGTDGQDGPTSAAGAFGCAEVVESAEMAGMVTGKYLEDNDSHTFYKGVCGGEFVLDTGLTGTNVMDLQILLVT